MICLNVPGIYYLFNSLSCKIYVGSTKNLRKRIMCHLWNLRSNRHQNVFLQRAWNKNGNLFFTGVLETCDIDKLLDREKFFIKLFKSRNMAHGYNLQSAFRDDRKKRFNKSVISEMSFKRKEFLKANPDIIKTQLSNMAKFWENKDAAEAVFKSRSKERRFFNEKTQESFCGSIGELRRKYVSDKLDKAALLRVSQGKNKRYKNWISQ